MLVTKKNIAEKAQLEFYFLLDLLTKPEETLKNYNLEVSAEDMEDIKAAMKQCCGFVNNKLADLGANAEGEEVKGYGGLCCNF